MIFASTDKEITLIYHSENRIGKQILAYAQTENLPIHEIDLAHTHVPCDHWAELAQRMGVEVKELINQEKPEFLQKFKGTTDLCDDDWLTILEHNPHVLRAPIVMKGKKIVMMNNPQEMLYFVERKENWRD